MNERITINKKTEEVDEPGVDHGSKPGILLALNKEYVAIKWPGTNYWSGIGSTSYASPEILIFKIKERKETENLIELKVELLIDWESKRKKEPILKNK